MERGGPDLPGRDIGGWDRDDPSGHDVPRDGEGPAAVAAQAGDPVPPPPRLPDLPFAALASAIIRALGGDQPEPGSTGRRTPQAPAAEPMTVPATVLWSRFLRFDMLDPGWPDRDRFVLASARFLPLLRALLRLTGHDDVPSGSGFGEHPAFETAPGPPGQGFATAVGMALAERALAARFGRTLVDHRTWVLACESDLVAGVSLEAAALAGQFRLEKLVVLFEPLPGSAAPSAETMTRFAACGWAVRRVDGADPEAVSAAIAAAMRVRRPTLIACVPSDGVPAVPEAPASGATELWAQLGQRAAGARRSWLKRLARHRLAPEFERTISSRLSAGFAPGWRDGWRAAPVDAGESDASGAPSSSLAAGRKGLLLLQALLPDLMTLHSTAGAQIAAPGGSLPPGAAVPAADEGGLPRQIRQIACGVQEHGMAALANGLSLHGGIRPVLGASFVSIDRMRPALRLAALMGQPVIYLLTDDGLALGQDGAAWQPVEQLASLRAMPAVAVFRPADEAEVIACWEIALHRDGGPSLLALCPRAPAAASPGTHPGTHPAKVLAMQAGAAERRAGCARGGYVLREVLEPAGRGRQATLIATGPEVAVALAAQDLLAEAGIATAVVSLPCWDLFATQAPSYRESILGDAPRIGIEAASGFGWERWLGQDGVFVGMEGFGAAAPADALYRQFGITPAAVAGRVRRRLGAAPH